MDTQPRAGTGGVRVSWARRSTLPAVTFALALALAPGDVRGQDPASGWWSGKVLGAGRSPEVVFMLQVDGSRISGRRVRVGEDPIPVSGSRVADSVHLHFRVPEGGRHVEVDISARMEGDRMAGTWRVVLPGGQRVERPWLAVRTRDGRLPNLQ